MVVEEHLGGDRGNVFFKLHVGGYEPIDWPKPSQANYFVMDPGDEVFMHTTPETCLTSPLRAPARSSPVLSGRL